MPTVNYSPRLLDSGNVEHLLRMIKIKPKPYPKLAGQRAWCILCGITITPRDMCRRFKGVASVGMTPVHICCHEQCFQHHTKD